MIQYYRNQHVAKAKSMYTLILLPSSLWKHGKLVNANEILSAHRHFLRLCSWWEVYGKSHRTSTGATLMPVAPVEATKHLVLLDFLWRSCHLVVCCVLVIFSH
jgi:hypothetical protein